MAIIVKKPIISPSLDPLYTSKTQNLRLVVGLGNPGQRYSHNRHNLGFMCLDKCAQLYESQWQEKPKLKSHLCSIDLRESRFILMKAQTYMNLSGEAVSLVAKFYKIEPQQIYIIHDDIRLKFGTIKVLETTENSGHNGLKSIQDILEAKLNLIQVGIGPKKPAEINLTDFVLADFSSKEIEKIPTITKEVSSLLGELEGNFKAQKRILF